MKRNLTFFTLQAIESIMEELGAVPRIFNSEAQFQFELAWKIKEEFDCEVKLEDLSRISEDNKNYTDIILEKDSLRIALELKYKTAKYEDESRNIYLKAHGAADLGAYDFLWDVHRIQLLTGVETSAVDEVKHHCDRGYAIILTNDAYYWTGATIKETINRDFLIGGSGVKGRGILYKKLHQWYTCEGVVGYSKTLKNNPSRQPAIDLKRNYFIQWKPYHKIDTDKTCNEFKYMIVEIAPNSTNENDMEVIDSMKDAIVFEIAKHIKKKYHKKDWNECVDLAKSASCWQKNYSIDNLSAISIEDLVAEVFNQIDNVEIK